MKWLLAAIAVVELVACKTRSAVSGSGSLKGVSYIYTINGSSVKADIDSSGVVKFYMDVKGNREEILSVDEAYSAGAIRASQDSSKNWTIKWQGVAIGSKRGDETEICGPKFGYADICDATFIQRDPRNAKTKNLMILGLLDKGLDLLPASAGGGASGSTGLNLTDTNSSSKKTTVDLSNFATTEINQNGTGTCLFNSTTGLLEWYLNRESGKMERLSAPYILAKLFENSTYSGELGALNQTKALKKAAPDQLLPTQQTYNQFSSFDGVFSYARRQASEIANGQVKLPALKTTKLFMLSQPAMGEFGGQGASTEQMKSVRDWIVNKQRPVHFFHYYYNTGIWHAVMAVGWDDSRQMIKIKDSLSQSGQRGQWKSVSSYQAMAYGALGTEEEDPSTISRPDSGRTNQNDKENNSDTGNDSTTNPSSTSDNSNSSTPTDNAGANLKWAAIIQGSTMYLYVSENVTEVSIRGYGNAWLPTTDSYQPQAGIPVIRGIYINRSSWLSQSSVDVRVNYNGKLVAASVPLKIY